MSTSAQQRRKIRLGDLLVEHGIISQQQLEQALAEQKNTGTKLGRTLIDLGFLSERQMLEFLSRQLSIPMVDLQHYQFEPEVVRRLSETHARRFRAIVLKETGDGFLIGMADPTDIFAFDELGRILGKPLSVAVVREADLLRTFDTVYRRTDEITNLAQELGQELEQSDFDVSQLMVEDDVADAPVVKLLQSLFEDAVQVGASDIHIEPDETALRIRQRVDGILHEQVMDQKRIAASVVLRLKLMAGLNISEKRLPQDGRFNITVKGRTIDVRMSTMPIQHGESVVMRLLDQSGDMLRL
jgi:MSHA biogenesis protein MshE